MPERQFPECQSLVITSAAFIQRDMISEFGELPPAFLPLGDRRLFVRQMQSYADWAVDCYITIPSTYEISACDARDLEALGLTPLFVDPALDLASSIAEAIKALPAPGSLTIVHGDTLLQNASPLPADTVAISRSHHHYRWATYKKVGERYCYHNELGREENDQSILCGGFHFSKSDLLLQALEKGDGFIEALNHYSRDCALRPYEVDTWLDFGNLDFYFQSKSRFLISRQFNNMAYEDGVLTKVSHQVDKLTFEADWFEALPQRLGIFTPKVLDRKRSSEETAYSLEYLNHPSLSELFVFGNLPGYSWRVILASCADFLKRLEAYRPEPGAVDLGALYETLQIEKTRARLEGFANGCDVDLDQPWVINGEEKPSLRALAEDLQHAIQPTSEEDLSIFHGDFCFSNILFDFRAERIRVIDPRGTIDGKTPSLYGDRRYDLAKLAHSALGWYDLIIYNRYSLDTPAPYHLDFSFHEMPVHRNVAQIVLGDLLPGDAERRRSFLAMMTTLFLSMLPLHSEDPRRQHAFIANAYRLHALTMEGGQ